MRASIYNAMPIEGVRRLVEYIARVRGEKRLKTGDGPERQLLADSSHSPGMHFSSSPCIRTASIA
jgi:hypothetical protein